MTIILPFTRKGFIYGNPKIIDSDDAPHFYRDHAFSVLNRLRKKHESGKMKYCVCECFDSTIFGRDKSRFHGEIWQNMDLIKLWYYENDLIITFETDICPICGAKLPTKTGGTKSNNMKWF